MGIVAPKNNQIFCVFPLPRLKSVHAKREHMHPEQNDVVVVPPPSGAKLQRLCMQNAPSEDPSRRASTVPSMQGSKTTTAAEHMVNIPTGRNVCVTGATHILISQHKGRSHCDHKPNRTTKRTYIIVFEQHCNKKTSPRTLPRKQQPASIPLATSSRSPSLEPLSKPLEQICHSNTTKTAYWISVTQPCKTRQSCKKKRVV